MGKEYQHAYSRIIIKYLLNTRTDWNEPPRARHQLAYALAKNNDVVFITINKSGKPHINNFHTDNITVIEPTWYIHGKFCFRIPLINELQIKKKKKNHLVIEFLKKKTHFTDREISARYVQKKNTTFGQVG